MRDDGKDRAIIKNRWGMSIGLKGTDGKDDSQIFAGTGLTDPEVGATEDFCLDKSIYNLFGPKTYSG